jgi:predicted metal-dependent hydrolase
MQIDDLTITLTRKSIKNLILRVCPDGSVAVSAPWLTPEEDIRTFVRGRRDWIARARERVARRAAASDTSDWTPHEKLMHFRALQEFLRDRLAYWAPRMGVSYSGFCIKGLKSKWGSCNIRTRQLTFNLYLRRWPDACIEYVVVHELAHLIVPNHSPAFYAVLDQYYPQWAECRRMMRGR